MDLHPRFQRIKSTHFNDSVLVWLERGAGVCAHARDRYPSVHVFRHQCDEDTLICHSAAESGTNEDIVYEWNIEMNIIGRKHIYLSFSSALVLASIIAVAIWGLRFGIDFTGGSLMEIEYVRTQIMVDEVRTAFNKAGIEHSTVQQTGENGWIIRFRPADENTHQHIVKELELLAIKKGTDGHLVEKRFESIGPTIGRATRNRALVALGLTIVAIVLYLAWAFRQVSTPVASWKYGVVAVATLIHDVSIPTGLFAFLGTFRGVEIDSLFITALLTVMGFSVHDTIVIFDRIRENLLRTRVQEPFADMVNKSVNETLIRSLNTSMTVMIVLAALYVYGESSVQYFTLALLVGILFGTYSSIFVASPLLVMWERKSVGKNKKKS